MCDIWQNFSFYRILINENFKMILWNYIIDYLKTRLLKFGQISFKW